MIGCACEVCSSNDPRDRRTRPSILMEWTDAEGRIAILVDTSTDLRTQALAYTLTLVDAILFTHTHADHIFGLDEVRRFNAVQGAPIPCFGDERTLADLRRIFAYIFAPSSEGGGTPK